MAETSYVPGVCNINKAEIAYRKKAMWFGVGLSLILFVGLLIVMAPWWLVIILLFVPVYIAAIGSLQVKNKFCVSYGANGKQNADDTSTAASTVSESDAQVDKSKSRKMNLQALAMTLVVLALAGIIAYSI